MFTEAGVDQGGLDLPEGGGQQPGLIDSGVQETKGEESVDAEAAQHQRRDRDSGVEETKGGDYVNPDDAQHQRRARDSGVEETKGGGNVDPDDALQAEDGVDDAAGGDHPDGGDRFVPDYVDDHPFGDGGGGEEMFERFGGMSRPKHT